MTYDVQVTREGRWWMIEVPALDLLTQARRVSEIEDQAVSIIAMELDVPASQVEVVVRSVKVGDVDALVLAQEARRLRSEAEAAEARAAEATAAAARSLAKVAPTRDVGEFLGVSHQRVSQLVSSR